MADNQPNQAKNLRINASPLGGSGGSASAKSLKKQGGSPAEVSAEVAEAPYLTHCNHWRRSAEVECYRYYVSIQGGRLRGRPPVDDDFGHGENLIPVAAVRIFWSHGFQPCRVRDVYVSRTDIDPHLVEAEYFSDRWECVVGNCDADWLRSSKFTPEAVFGELLVTGFASNEEAVNAIRQFAQIDVCAWARLALDRIGGIRA